MSNFKSKLKHIKFKYIVGIIPFLITLIPALIYKLYLKIFNKELWLICEEWNMARDNGYIFFKYMKENHPNIKCYYAINKKCNDYNKVVEYEPYIISFESIRHYFYYMSATLNLSSHKNGNPNELIFTILHLYLHMFNNRVFLQHGITCNDLPMFYKKNSRFKYFICGAKPEYDYILSRFGYSSKELKYTGFSRFDNLNRDSINNKTILLIPTWRRWISNNDQFLDSLFYKRWNSFINNPDLIKLLEDNNITLYFYPHVHIQQYKDNFNISSNNIKLLDINKADIQTILKEGALLITDYSSLFMDFSYMEKPVILYQFDYDEVNLKHTKFGYFNYEKAGFGKVVYDESDLIDKLSYYINNNYSVENEYIERINNFFPLRDNKNCERIYNEIIKR